MNVAFITSVATVCIATFVAIIAFNQWRINRDKLRLDLFNRRFDVYLRVLDYYQELFNGNGAPDAAITTSFLKAVRESRFIFPKASGVHQFLEELWTRANDYSRYIDRKELEDTRWLLEAMSNLETKMEPFITFESL
jgi:hypothetical protein